MTVTIVAGQTVPFAVAAVVGAPWGTGSRYSAMFVTTGEVHYSDSVVHTFAVDVSDGVATVRTNVTVGVTDVDDQAPTFAASSYAFNIVDDALATVGQVVGYVVVGDSDGTPFNSFNIAIDADNTGFFQSFALSPSNCTGSARSR